MRKAADRALELLIERITEGLDPERERELNELLAQCPEIDAESYELAAAAVELTVTDTSEPLPPALRERVSNRAEAYFAAPPVSVDRAARSDAPWALSPYLGWLAAAAILVAAFALWPRVDGPVILPVPPESVPPGSAEPAEPAEPAPSIARDALIAAADDLLRLDLSTTEDPAARAAEGDVVWSTAAQKGYMRLSGLPVNDPSVEQYQLWIFDAEQDERYPVSAGVFNVEESGEIVVELDAGLEIREPTLFAVTVEKPGGVVVSDRERLALMAQVG